MQWSKTFQIFPKVPRSFFLQPCAFPRPPAPDPGFDTEVMFRMILLVLFRHVVAGQSCRHPSGMFSCCCFFFFLSFLYTSGLLAGKEDCTGETKRFLILRVGERVFKCPTSVTHAATHTELLAISFSQGSASSGQRQGTSLRKSSSGLGLIARLAISLLAPV